MLVTPPWPLGQGSGDREDVAKHLGGWFEETPELADARASVDKGLQHAWRDVVLGPLVAAWRVDSEDVADLGLLYETDRVT